MEKLVECYGCITKVENLWCIEEFGIPNTCILESLQVFPGYYDQYTKHIKPRYVYIMSKQKHSLEEITRMTSEVRKSYQQPFDAAYCEITIGNKVCGGVRIAGIVDYSVVKELQLAYSNSGLILKKKVKKIENAHAIIKVRKFFKLQVLNDNIFLDKTQTDIGYFKVKNDVPWVQFEKIIPVLRNNWSGNSFDAAKSFIYQNSEITDMVRIYSKDISGEFLEQLRVIYLRYAE